MAQSTLPQRSFRFHYSTGISSKLSAEGDVDVWVPLPKTDALQTIGKVQIESPVPAKEGIEPKSQNRMLHLQVPRGSPDVKIVTHFDVTRKRYRVDKPEESSDYGGPLDMKQFGSFLAPNANVPIDGFIAYQAKSITDRRDPPVVRARKIFDYLMSTLEYDWAGCTPDRIDELGNLAQACDLRKGTCTEFHGLYVGYSRAMGIPAKFNFGFGIPADKQESVVAGYHCWSEIYLPKVGWFPVDVTEAIKEKSRGLGQPEVDFFFGGSCAHRVHFTVGRDLWLEPRQAGGLVDKFIFSHAVRGDEKVEPDLSFWISPALGAQKAA